jgi:signal transduction histidine kinase
MMPAPAAISDRPDHSRAAARVSVVAGLAVAAVGAFVICGWTWNVEAFKTIYGPITMKTNTAIGLLLCGTSLAALAWSPRLSTICAAVAGLIGAATLSEILIGWDLGIDQALFTEPPGAAATASPNRMGPNGAISLLLAGLSLSQLARGTARGAARAQRLASVALVLASIPIAGYLYGAAQLYGIAHYTGIALHTALAFIALNVGILMARATLGPVAVFLGDGPASTMLRRLALPIVAIPLVLGYVEIYGWRAGIVDRGLGMALLAVSLIVVLGITVWHTAQVIERSDAARRRAERERDGLIVSEQEARAEAERASRLKDQFLATLSHELRTPLNVMLGWTQILEQGTDPAGHVRIAGLVARNGRLLARLVEDLLDLSRVTAGQLQIARAPTRLNTVVEGALEAIRPTAVAKGVDLVAELDRDMQPIDADHERLQQIVWNLLSNAVKFTGAGGRIVVRTAQAARDATLVVADTGIGFDRAFASEVFKPFRQADSTPSREHGGLGLGLSIARHIAELHGGALTGSSPGIGQGATFTLQLPRPTTFGAEVSVA